MRLFILAVVISLLMEGIAYAVFPEMVRESMREISEQPAECVRSIGSSFIAFALILLFGLWLFE